MKIITRIVIAIIPIMFVIALMVSLTGFKGPIQLDQTYYNFIKSVNQRYQSWSVSIPDIPTIPNTGNVGGWWQVVEILINFFNALIRIINIIVLVINKVIQLIQFMISLFIELFYFKNSFEGVGSTSTSQPIEWWS